MTSAFRSIAFGLVAYGLLSFSAQAQTCNMQAFLTGSAPLTKERLRAENAYWGMPTKLEILKDRKPSKIVMTVPACKAKRAMVGALTREIDFAGKHHSCLTERQRGDLARLIADRAEAVDEMRRDACTR